MSTRVLKKLQGPSDLDLLKDLSLDEGDDDDSGPDAKGNNSNPFDLLIDQSVSESEVKEDDNETENPSTSSEVSKKKKKKKRKKKPKNAATCSDDNEKLPEKQHKVKPQIATQPASKPAANGAAPVAAPAEPTLREHLQRYNGMLQVELRHLNPQNEMRRKFGKHVIKTESKRGRLKLSCKSAHLVNMKDKWPPHNKNFLSMRLVEAPRRLRPKLGPNDNGIHWFEFEHSVQYQKVQKLFVTSIKMNDAHFMINLVRSNPYHVASLLHLADMCNQADEFSLSGDLVERAVFSLESALHPNFSLTSGNSYLDYSRQENRDFFVTLFRHALLLESRACSRTALEVSKLLLNLNPISDPLAMVLVIDYYALRSHQYEWLVEFVDQLDAYRNLRQLPNMAYSYALAKFNLKGECDESTKALQYAVEMFPGVLLPLMDELSHPVDERVKGCEYFASGISANQSPSLDQLVCLYVCRAKVVWRMPNALTWLGAMAKVVLERYESGDPVFADYKAKRTSRYVSPPRAILRHVILSDYKEKVPLSEFLAPADIPLHSYDPLPPFDSVSCYEKKSRNGLEPSPIPMTNSVSQFFQSLLPNFVRGNPADQPPNPEQVDDEAPPMAPAPAPAAAAAPLQAHHLNVLNNYDSDEEITVDLGPLADNMEILEESLEQMANAVQSDELRQEVAAAANTYQELSQSYANIVVTIREFLDHSNTQGANDLSEDGDNNADEAN